MSQFASSSWCPAVKVTQAGLLPSLEGITPSYEFPVIVIARPIGVAIQKIIHLVPSSFTN
jgi:hypothetical protein